MPSECYCALPIEFEYESCLKCGGKLPGPKPEEVTLTLAEAQAVRAYIMGDAFDAEVIDSVLGKLVDS